MMVMGKRFFLIVVGLLIVIIVSSCGGSTQATSSASSSNGDYFNAPGNVLISDQFNNRVLIINPKVEFEYGRINVTGNAPGQLNGPYTSYVIGDYTGQTPPPTTF